VPPSRRRLSPVDEQESEVGDWIAQGAYLPVENGPHGPILVEDGVVKTVITVHHRHALLSRYRRRELVADRLYESA